MEVEGEEGEKEAEGKVVDCGEEEEEKWKNGKEKAVKVGGEEVAKNGEEAESGKLEEKAEVGREEWEEEELGAVNMAVPGEGEGLIQTKQRENPLNLCVHLL